MRRILILLLVALLLPSATTAQPAVRLTLDPALQAEPYTGRVYLVLAKAGSADPRLGIGNWFSPPQVIAQDVRAIAPGAPIAFDASAIGFPRMPADIKPGEYTVQAVARRSLDSPVPGHGAGDLYSDPVNVEFPPAADAPLEIRLSRVVETEPAAETARFKVVEFVSPSLSAFHKREVKVRAGVLLPEDWKGVAGPDSRAVIYFITGFGGDHTTARGIGGMFALPAGSAAKQPLIVVPDPTCATGHSVFADSDNNGPWGKALIEELIPAVETRFHSTGGAAHRFITGISSGGWSSLWLQVTYPDTFAGCWSHCPDPVDFRDFQRINLYAPGANMYTVEGGKRRPLARAGPRGGGGEGGGDDNGGGERVILWYDNFCRMERVLGHGGQIGSFEAVFSRRGADGQPESLFDRDTGAVSAEVAKSWERYDIRLILERNWATLGPKLKGKLHIYAGGVDTFYLEGAATLLKESLEKLGSDAEVTIVPGMPHSIHGPGVQAMMRTIAGDVAP